MQKDENKKFVELEWICPNCDGRNKGSKKTCANCGAPQPDDVKFHRAADEKIITDEKAVAAAKAGADIHCGFCGTRNPGNAVSCSQCGGDLKEGKARQSGQVLQAAAPAPKAVNCSNCGAENPGTGRVCKECGAPIQAAPVAAASRPAQTPTASKTPAAAPKKVNWLLFGGIGAFLLIYRGGDALCRSDQIGQRDSDRPAMANLCACAGNSACKLFQQKRQRPHGCLQRFMPHG